MTTARSIVCGSCGADVPYGRLSCLACGDLLASVAGGTRRASGGDPEADAGAGAAAAPDVASPAVMAASATSSFAPPIVDGVQAPPRTAAPSLPAAELLPGAYVPPLTPAMAVSFPAGPAAPARAWAGYRDTAPAPDMSAAGGIARAAATGTDARVAEFIGWLAIAGGALSAVGFLLPWGASMIGAIGIDFFARWGLAGPFHGIVALAVVVTVVLAIVPNPVPAWIRVGMAGTILGTFLLGLVWPYIFGFSVTGPGAYAVAVGAAGLLAAGIASLAADRHARRTLPV